MFHCESGECTDKSSSRIQHRCNQYRAHTQKTNTFFFLDFVDSCNQSSFNKKKKFHFQSFFLLLCYDEVKTNWDEIGWVAVCVYAWLWITSEANKKVKEKISSSFNKLKVLFFRYFFTITHSFFGLCLSSSVVAVVVVILVCWYFHCHQSLNSFALYSIF